MAGLPETDQKRDHPGQVKPADGHRRRLVRIAVHHIGDRRRDHARRQQDRAGQEDQPSRKQDQQHGQNAAGRPLPPSCVRVSPRSSQHQPVNHDPDQRDGRHHAGNDGRDLPSGSFLISPGRRSHASASRPPASRAETDAWPWRYSISSLRMAAGSSISFSRTARLPPMRHPGGLVLKLLAVSPAVEPLDRRPHQFDHPGAQVRQAGRSEALLHIGQHVQ